MDAKKLRNIIERRGRAEIVASQGEGNDKGKRERKNKQRGEKKAKESSNKEGMRKQK